MEEVSVRVCGRGFRGGSVRVCGGNVTNIPSGCVRNGFTTNLRATMECAQVATSTRMRVRSSLAWERGRGRLGPVFCGGSEEVLIVLIACFMVVYVA